MTELAPYPAYKDSGVAWAPRLPAEWSKSRLSRVSTIFAGGTPDRTNPDFWTDGTVPWLNSGSVNDGVITSHSELITQQAATGSSTRWAHAGSVVVALAGQGKTKGMAARLEISSTFNQSMAAIVPNRTLLDYRFLHHWLTSNYQSIRNLAGGDLRDGLNLQHVGSIQVPLPPLIQQVAIADFLDRETAEIDTFIADQEELIGLLTERRAATITHAVTKGIEASAAMKDSGVEWLGEVPSHWTVTPLKVLAQVQTGVTLGKDFDNGVELPYLRVANVQVGRVDLTEVKTVSVSRVVAASSLLRSGDVLMTEGGDRDKLGRGAIWNGQIEPCLHQNHVFAVRCDPSLLSSKLLVYVLDGLPARSYFSSTAKQTTNLAATNSTIVRDFRFGVPSVEEQARVVSHLDHETAELDATIADAREAIALSKERRAALISAAVTGKIDVRGLA